MECTIVKMVENEFEVSTVEFSYKLLDHPDIVWIDCLTNDRSQFDQLENHQLIGGQLMNLVKLPGQSFKIQRFRQASILDIDICYQFDGDPSFLTFLLFEKLIITISIPDNILANKVTPQEIVDRLRKNTRYHILMGLLNVIVDYNASITKMINSKVDTILKNSLNVDFIDDVPKLERIYTEIIDLQELLEDQLTTIQFVPKDENVEETMYDFLEKTEKSMMHMQNVISRSEDKITYLFLRHRSSLQEKGNRRLNTLTIIQSIFVPLTFVAGIYGMNFARMPELNWPYGYLYVWIIMLLIAVGCLYLFYRNGWFKKD